MLPPLMMSLLCEDALLHRSCIFAYASLIASVLTLKCFRYGFFFVCGVILASVQSIQAQDLWHQPIQGCGGPCSVSQIQENPKLLIFVSFSMPEASLKALAREATLCGGILVLRGLYQESIKKTAQKVRRLGIQVQIDPPLFQDYAVHTVPTFVLRKRSRFDKAAGHVPLRYALETFLKEGELKKEASLLLKTLKGETS